MARIKQLSPQEAQKIAAGEVVERPANVVKELVENSLDAGATQVSLYIQDSGKSLIRIVDNGYGMNQEDAHLCFKHHATSKITRVDDLPTISTFGFRGEALSSISSVSKVTLITKEADAPHATKLVLENGVVISQEEVSGNTGTDISIADLFYNVPARKKFLKTNETEWRQILLLFQALCLDYKEVHFKLHSQGNLLFNCPATNDVTQRIAQLWDHTVAQQILPIKAAANGLSFEGIISNHTYTRYDRSSIFFFVNNRWVKNHTLGKALLKGYLNVLPPDKFPLACIAIIIDPVQVDINIHPRKEEVQFLHPRIVENALQAAVKETLEKNLSAQLNKKVSFNSEQTWNAMPHPIRHSSHNEPEFFHPNMNQSKKPQFSHLNTRNAVSYSLDTLQENKIKNSYEINPSNEFIEHHQNVISSAVPTQTEYNIIGQFHKTYILIEQEESLFLVDQHAAHERILYELFCTRFEHVATIQLMFPAIITLTHDELQILEPHLSIFSKNNIALEIMGSNQLIIQAIPVHLKEVPLEELVRQTLGWIEENQKLDNEQLYKKVNEKLHAQMACKAAVKAGDVLTLSQMHQLLRDLEKIENRFTCPHGRPTGWNIALYDIEKKFKRKL